MSYSVYTPCLMVAQDPLPVKETTYRMHNKDITLSLMIGMFFSEYLTVFLFDLVLFTVYR